MTEADLTTPSKYSTFIHKDGPDTGGHLPGRISEYQNLKFCFEGDHVQRTYAEVAFEGAESFTRLRLTAYEHG